MTNSCIAGGFILLVTGCCCSLPAKEVHHYVFFGQDRERIFDAAFLGTSAFKGAQLKYSWRELEQGKDGYDFSAIEHDLRFLNSKGKRLFVQLQDVTFDPSLINVPRYLLNDPRYNGGAAKQYRIPDDDEARAVPEGWVARRWDAAVQKRFHQLLSALGKQFDGRIEGINLAETAVDFGQSGRLYPQGFSPATYRDAVLTNMSVLKRSFPKSVTMPYEHVNPKTGKQMSIPELIGFATEHLNVDFMFWCIEEPFYSRKLIPFLQAQG